jgi:hypothetical protein
MVKIQDVVFLVMTTCNEVVQCQCSLHGLIIQKAIKFQFLCPWRISGKKPLAVFLHSRNIAAIHGFELTITTENILSACNIGVGGWNLCLKNLNLTGLK